MAKRKKSGKSRRKKKPAPGKAKRPAAPAPAARGTAVGPEERTRRRNTLAHYLQEEISGMLDVMELRLPMLLELWSKHRSREPFLKTLRSHFHEIRADDLLDLKERTISLLNEYYRNLDELTLYLQYTEDMVLTLEETIRRSLGKMTETGKEILKLLDEEKLRG